MCGFMTSSVSLKLDMNACKDEDKLPEMYAAYDRLNHAFEQENGYALQSEVTGVLKGLGFTEEDFNKRYLLSREDRKREFPWDVCF